MDLFFAKTIEPRFRPFSPLIIPPLYSVIFSGLLCTTKGNSVAIPVIEAVASNMIEAIQQLQPKQSKKEYKQLTLLKAINA